MSDAAGVDLSASATPPNPALLPERSGQPILALISDLMLSVQVESSAAGAGLLVTIVSSAGALSDGLLTHQPRLIVFDLADGAFSFADAYRLVRETVPSARVLAFYPHVRTELGEMARSAGCDLVMPRSRFLTNVAGALRDALPGDSQ